MPDQSSIDLVTRCSGAGPTCRRRFLVPDRFDSVWSKDSVWVCWPHHQKKIRAFWALLLLGFACTWVFFMFTSNFWLDSLLLPPFDVPLSSFKANISTPHNQKDFDNYASKETRKYDFIQKQCKDHDTSHYL